MTRGGHSLRGKVARRSMSDSDMDPLVESNIMNRAVKASRALSGVSANLCARNVGWTEVRVVFGSGGDCGVSWGEMPCNR